MTTLRGAIRFTQTLVQTGVLCAVLAAAPRRWPSRKGRKEEGRASLRWLPWSRRNKPVMADAPRLAGQHYDYLVQALAAYRKGSRQNSIMSAMAQPLTEQEIRELALYYSTQQGLAIKY